MLSIIRKICIYCKLKYFSFKTMAFWRMESKNTGMLLCLIGSKTKFNATTVSTKCVKII